MKSAGDNHYHEQNKLLHFERNWNRNKETGYKEKFKSTPIGFVAMSIRTEFGE